MTIKKPSRSKNAADDASDERGNTGASAGSAKQRAKESGDTPFKAIRVEREIGGRVLSLETGRMAKQADGACLAQYGETVVLATAQSDTARADIDFFPLTVDYREKAAAAGKVPGGFFKREGRPTSKEILTCRIIDRSIRPLFPDGFRREVQIISQVFATDQENDADMVGAVAAFTALALSSIPNGQTLGMCRIGLVDEKLRINPTWSVLQDPKNALNLIVAGHQDAIVMVEAGARQVTEAVMLEALELAHKVVRDIVGMVDELVAKAGKAKIEWEPPSRDDELAGAIERQFGDALRRAPVTGGNKEERKAAVDAVKTEVAEAFPAPEGATDNEIKAHQKKVSGFIGEITKKGEREAILSGRRSDGRNSSTIRPITVEVGVLPRVHGSALFTRGETQALVVTTLGGVDDQQFMDGIYPEPRKRFMLHYNFPPFSVGEARRFGFIGRREIGHGALAERSLEPLLPQNEAFPYTIRITSEILESNGSSSMASVCGGTMALMDAGVPIEQPVAGIAMGLVMENGKYAILSDILGSEDHCGDMDFKVAGTGRGITALQMDIKCDGLTREILAEALEQAHEGRLHILREMLKALRQPRQELSPNAPRLLSLQIPVDKIGAVIGPAGRNIRALQEEYEVKISIEDTGMVTICGVNGEKVDTCIDYLRAMTAEVEVGSVYKGRVTSIKEFGAFIEILPSQEGLCHVSELSDTFIRSVTDVVRIGDEIEVKVIGIDDFGKVKLSRKALLVGDGDKPGEGDRDRGRDRDRDPDRDRSRGRDRDRGRGRGGEDRDRSEHRPRGRSEEEREHAGSGRESSEVPEDPVTVVGELEEPGQLLEDSGSPAPEPRDRGRRRSRRPRSE